MEKVKIENISHVLYEFIMYEFTFTVNNIARKAKFLGQGNT
jgi:hypothetical protein